MIESLKPLYNRSSHLGEQLVNDGLISEEQLQEALTRQIQSKKRLGETLLQMNCIPPKTLGRYLEAAIRCQFFELAEWDMAPVRDLVSAFELKEDRVRKYQALPIKDRGYDVLVAMSDPLNLGVVDEMRMYLNRSVTPVLCFDADLNQAIDRVFLHGVTDIEIEPETGVNAEPDPPTWEEVESGPVVEAVNQIITGAIANGASDIHIEPMHKAVRVRYRIDGLLMEQTHIRIPPKSHAAVASRIKIMASCDIAERRRPQDGRIPYRNKTTGRENDIRVSIMPTIYGEKVVMRILERNRQTSLEQVGFFPEQLQAFEAVIKRPFGMILITGPTGSGKSTTLQAALQKINNPALNISTVEDPVEYQIAGVNHTQVDPKIGVTFAKGLTTLVRQDPDIIMVGEIRDRETAEIAINAALTGHLVLSTLHTNDAPGAMARLVNMGIEPYLITSSMIAVIGQRLIRTICPHCKEERMALPSEMEALGIPHTEEFSTMLAQGAGCARCGNRGFKGRTAVYEIMAVTEEIRQLTLKRASSTDIKEKAVQQGMKTMYDSGVRKVLQRETTLEEVTRVLVIEGE